MSKPKLPEKLATACEVADYSGYGVGRINDLIDCVKWLMEPRVYTEPHSVCHTCKHRYCLMESPPCKPCTGKLPPHAHWEPEAAKPVTAMEVAAAIERKANICGKCGCTFAILKSGQKICNCSPEKPSTPCVGVPGDVKANEHFPPWVCCNDMKILLEGGMGVAWETFCPTHGYKNDCYKCLEDKGVIGTELCQYHRAHPEKCAMNMPKPGDKFVNVDFFDMSILPEAAQSYIKDLTRHRDSLAADLETLREDLK